MRVGGALLNRSFGKVVKKRREAKRGKTAEEIGKEKKILVYGEWGQKVQNRSTKVLLLLIKRLLELEIEGGGIQRKKLKERKSSTGEKIPMIRKKDFH